jgi:glycosyltransferase involved in cell wall biosynthesis
MKKLGHNVVVAGLYPLGYGEEDEFTDEGVKVYRFRLGLDAKWFNDQQSLKMRIVKRLLKHTGILQRDIEKSLLRYQNTLEQIITKHQIDLVEMPDYNDYVKFCYSFVPFPKLSIPMVMKLHGSITYFAREANKKTPSAWFKTEYANLKQAAAVISVSRYTADKSAEYFSYSDKIEVIYNGINTDIPDSLMSKNPLQVIFTGSLVEKKGIYQLAKAWNIVNSKRPDARLLVLGKGDQEKVMGLLNDDSKSTVSFKGHVPSGELFDYLSESSIGVFPSYSESFGLAVLEAMLCGNAVVNSRRTAGPELVDDRENGLLIDPDNTEEIATAILYLLDNPDRCAGLAKNGVQKVKTCFDINNIAIQNQQFYNRILKS